MVIPMDAMWWGGPLDGAVVEIPDGAREYAVAYDHHQHMLDAWAELQDICITGELDTSMVPEELDNIRIYRVAYPPNTGFTMPVVVFRHVPMP